ncbi:MAG TPA: helix-turn-helix domain-containing protein [Solirubrobacterales bacterium]|nr:helix-turn-helix domain-containing protein [Solirubrobacterales bacterium]
MRRLPPGPHGLPPELVERNQRERLIAAMAEVSAEKGYGATSVADVARGAGVSTASFYRQFRDKRECMLASFEELFGRLLGGIEGACAEGAEPKAKLRRGVRTASALLDGDLPTARLLTIEIAAVGPEGVRLQHKAIERLAQRLRAARGLDVEEPPIFPDREWAAVAAIVALVVKRVAAEEAIEAAEIEAICGL